MAIKKLQKDIFEDAISANPHGIFAAFAKQARREGWTPDEVKHVEMEAFSGDYDHVIQTCMAHIE